MAFVIAPLMVMGSGSMIVMVSITVFPFQQLSRKEAPDGQALGLLHEGPTGYFDEELEEIPSRVCRPL